MRDLSHVAVGRASARPEAHHGRGRAADDHEEDPRALAGEVPAGVQGGALLICSRLGSGMLFPPLFFILSRPGGPG